MELLAAWSPHTGQHPAVYAPWQALKVVAGWHSLAGLWPPAIMEIMEGLRLEPHQARKLVPVLCEDLRTWRPRTVQSSPQHQPGLGLAALLPPSSESEDEQEPGQLPASAPTSPPDTDADMEIDPPAPSSPEADVPPPLPHEASPMGPHLPAGDPLQEPPLPEDPPDPHASPPSTSTLVTTGLAAHAAPGPKPSGGPRSAQPVVKGPVISAPRQLSPQPVGYASEAVPASLAHSPPRQPPPPAQVRPWCCFCPTVQVLDLKP